MDKPPRILSIEDEATVRRSIVSYLEDSGFEMLEAENGRQGLDLFYKEHPDIVLCDLRMPEVDGLTVLAEVAKNAPETPFIIISGTGDIGDAIEALKLGAWDYMRKPIEDLAELEHSIRRSLERSRLIRENRETQRSLEETNKRLRRSLQQIKDDESAARQIQLQLLPKPKMVFRGYEFSYYMKASSELSGDFVDYFIIDDCHTGFYIADVSGHGVSSAFITVLLKSTVSNLLDQYRQTENNAILQPSRVLQLINDSIIQQGFNKHLTIFYAVTHEDEHTITFSNGGHFPFPLLFDGEKARFLSNKNLPVGLFENAEYPNRTIAVPEQFAMALFSDGVLEILPQQSLQNKEEFLLSQVGSMDVSLDQLTRELHLDSTESPLDDVTLMLVKKGM